MANFNLGKVLTKIISKIRALEAGTGPISNIFVKKAGDTMTGTLTMKRAGTSTDALMLRGDSEGGNIDIYSGGSHTNYWEIDSYNGDLRVYTYRESDGAFRSASLSQDGVLTVPTVVGNLTGNCSGSSGSCTGNAATATQATYANKDIYANPLIGDMYFSTTSTGSGYILLTFNNTNAWMCSFTLRLYQGYVSTDLLISGYNYGGSNQYWYSPSAVWLGGNNTSSTTVYFGYTSLWNLWVAVPATNYTGATIVGLNTGYINSGKGNAITITKVSSLPGTTQTTVVVYPQTDYVVASGTSNGWDYRKWKSGRAEAWYVVSQYPQMTNLWGSVYESQAFSYPSNPSGITFTKVFIDARPWDAGTAILSVEVAGSYYYLTRGTQHSGTWVNVYMYGVGTWS